MEFISRFVPFEDDGQEIFGEVPGSRSYTSSHGNISL